MDRTTSLCGGEGIQKQHCLLFYSVGYKNKNIFSW